MVKGPVHKAQTLLCIRRTTTGSASGKKALAMDRIKTP